MRMALILGMTSILRLSAAAKFKHDGRWGTPTRRVFGGGAEACYSPANLLSAPGSKDYPGSYNK